MKQQPSIENADDNRDIEEIMDNQEELVEEDINV
jgi:hypothetical protein